MSDPTSAPCHNLQVSTVTDPEAQHLTSTQLLASPGASSFITRSTPESGHQKENRQVDATVRHCLSFSASLFPYSDVPSHRVPPRSRSQCPIPSTPTIPRRSSRRSRRVADHQVSAIPSRKPRRLGMRPWSQRRPRAGWRMPLTQHLFRYGVSATTSEGLAVCFASNTYDTSKCDEPLSTSWILNLIIDLF